MRRVGVLMVVLLLWPPWSIGGALTAPGTDSTSARLAEWTRSSGLSWAVSDLEQAQYKMNPPKVGGSLAGGIPRIAPSRKAPNQPTRPASYLAPPRRPRLKPNHLCQARAPGRLSSTPMASRRSGPRSCV
jgi:hypothetical protein